MNKKTPRHGLGSSPFSPKLRRTLRGKFIAIYGVNNIGKSTQTRLLLARLAAAGTRVEYHKYPLYDLDPTGKQLNEILRGKQKSSVQTMIEFFPGTRVRRPGVQTGPTLFKFQPIRTAAVKQNVTEEELQMWYSLNRYQYDPTVRRKLAAGLNILAEDYTGTGLAWGAAKGADLAWLESVNKFLTKPDLEILLDGQRFGTGRETGHLHESSDRLIEKARAQFRRLAKKYDWQVVSANQPVQTVNDQIWGLVHPLLRRQPGQAATAPFLLPPLPEK